LDDLFRLIFGLDGESLWEIRRYNRRLYQSGLANRHVIQHTTIGWRPDPWGEADGFTPDPGNSRRREDGSLDTPSGNVEYHRVFKDGRKK
jgi:hypothetical protein